MSDEPNRIKRPTGCEHEAPSRRGFVGAVLGVIGLGFVAEWLWAGLGYALPRQAGGKKEPFTVSKKDILGNPKGQRVPWGGGGAIVIPVDGKVRAFDLKCSHLGCMVNWEHDKQQFFCPCHEATFSKNGEVLSGPPPLPLEELSVVPEESDPNTLIVGGE